mgnify:FL=1
MSPPLPVPATTTAAAVVNHHRRRPGWVVVLIIVLVTAWLVFENMSGRDGQSVGNIISQCFSRSFNGQDRYARAEASTIKSLADICAGWGFLDLKFPTDKCSKHNYVQIYETVLAPFRARAEPVRLLEVGVKQGGSIKLWREYLSLDSVVFGLDINPGVPMFLNDPNIKILHTNSNDLDLSGQSYPSFRTAKGCLHVIIDDGFHSYGHQFNTFNALRHYLCRDGSQQQPPSSPPAAAPSAIYVIEDVSPSALPLLQRLLQDAKVTFTTHIDKSGEAMIVMRYRDGVWLATVGRQYGGSGNSYRREANLYAFKSYASNLKKDTVSVLYSFCTLFSPLSTLFTKTPPVRAGRTI